MQDRLDSHALLLAAQVTKKYGLVYYKWIKYSVF